MQFKKTPSARKWWRTKKWKREIARRAKEVNPSHAKFFLSRAKDKL